MISIPWITSAITIAMTNMMKPISGVAKTNIPKAIETIPVANLIIWFPFLLLLLDLLFNILTIPLIKRAIPIIKIRNLRLATGFEIVNTLKPKIAAPNAILVIRDFFDKEGKIIPVKIFSIPTIDNVIAIKEIVINGSISGIATAKMDKMTTKLPIPICTFLTHFGTETSCDITKVSYLFIEILLLMFIVCFIF